GRPRERAGARAGLAPGGPFEHLLQAPRPREEGGVGEVGLAPRLEPGVRHARQVLMQSQCEARLPDPRLAGDQHELPLTLLCLLEPCPQETAFLAPVHERSKPEHGGGSEPAAYAARLHHPVQLDELRLALPLARPPPLAHDPTRPPPT